MLYFLYPILLLFSITSAAVDVKGFESFPINPKNNETTIKVTKDSNFILIIFEDGTTDYNWYLDANDSSKTIVPMNLDEKNTGEFESRSKGGGYVFFKFHPINSGNAIVSFEYKKYEDLNPLNKIFVNIEIIDISYRE